MAISKWICEETIFVSSFFYALNVTGGETQEGGNRESQ
jgi:hypothetical protein